ncbi:response regulator transcription factor [Colwellia sp. Bg11-12]|uniref:response regulator transcription factor n=1 Tax=Colwellia sp. Bg11-12 TaxID=2759817 RepID=UPI0015F6C6A3|nr:response regulator transcription factor [Colwellia sp. Bg11-12]MBA6262254.1 response regulator transcription factor [Colwellia sp. Bg11-12]
MSNILIVEDDEHIREMLLYILEKEEYSVIGVASAEAALSHCMQEKPDLILLDIELPGINGYQFCECLQRNHANKMPLIIMLTDQIDVSDIEKGLASFADDYIAKPFNPRLLVARIKANLRRLSGLPEPVTTERLSSFGVTIDVPTRHVTLHSEHIPLQKMEFDILYLLMSSPNRVFSRDSIIYHSKGENYYIADRAIDNQIYKLRKKLGEAGKHLETVSGIGYRFSASVT